MRAAGPADRSRCAETGSSRSGWSSTSTTSPAWSSTWPARCSWSRPGRCRWTGRDARRRCSTLARDAVRRTAGDPRHALVGATLAVPGLVRADNRTVAWAPNVGLSGDALAARLERELGGVGLRGPVRVSNDANCAAYAETHHGAATDSSHVLYLTGTVGIGAGIVEDGDLVRGAAGFAGEVGHMPVGDPAALCGCGRQRLLGGVDRPARDARRGRA